MIFKMRTLVPLHDRVVVKREADADEEEGLIVRTDASRERPVEGIVVWIGTGKLLENGTVIPIRVAVGDRVLFGKYSGQDVTIGDEEYLILREDEVLGIIKVVEVNDMDPAQGSQEPSQSEE